jgi:hypothetical protein
LELGCGCKIKKNNRKRIAHLAGIAPWHPSNVVRWRARCGSHTIAGLTQWMCKSIPVECRHNRCLNQMICQMICNIFLVLTISTSYDR